MNEKELIAGPALGYVIQWALFGPKRVPAWISWPALAVASVGLYLLVTPTFMADWATNWRDVVFSVVRFALMAKGTGSAAAATPFAPRSNTL